MPEYTNFLAPLNKPTYVIRFGWLNWGTEAKLRWLAKLEDALYETLFAVEDEINRLADRFEKENAEAAPERS